MIFVEHGIAYAVEPSEFAILVEDRANGVMNPLNCYGYEVGGCGGDVTNFGQAGAIVLRAALAGLKEGASEALTIKLAEIEALINEETMFLADSAVIAA